MIGRALLGGAVLLTCAWTSMACGQTLTCQRTFAASELAFPFGAATDATGNLYVADATAKKVDVFDHAGTLTSQIDTSALSWPSIVAVGGGTVYVAGTTVVPYVGGLAGTALAGPTLNGPMAMAVDGTGNVYVADTGNNRIVKFLSTGSFITIGTAGTGDGQLSHPYGVALGPEGGVYVSDSFNNRVEEFSATGTYVRQFSTLEGLADNRPKSLVLDAQGDIFMSLGDNAVARFSNDGTLESLFTDPSTLDRMNGVALAGDTLYAVETGRHQVYAFTVPEPGSIGLLGMAALAMFWRRRTGH